MKKLWSSFRVRLLVGSIAWTLGLLYVTHVTSILIMIGPQAFASKLRVSALMLVAVVFMAFGAVTVQRSMASFAELRKRLGDVHSGRERQVAGVYFSEVRPLVDDLNILLDHRDRRVREALAKAGDLAHGLKTPLAVLSHEAERLQQAGHHDIASILSQQVERMRRHVEYHLAHARAAASGSMPGVRCSVSESMAGLTRTLARLHANRSLRIDVAVSDEHAVSGQRADLDEIFGNLLDNACKWARARIEVSSVNGDGRIAITVDDDGPGIAPSMRAAVLQRGVRADEGAPGTGFGLAIVRDLVDVYGGSIELTDSPLGGLRARVQLPQARS
jgi:signal transduction histidine kinase